MSPAADPAVWVVLPAYNEAAALPALLEAFVRVAGQSDPAASKLAGLRLVVVDDGSTDGTGEVARAFGDRLPITVLPHALNRGLAAAMRTGLEHVCAAGAPGDIVVTMDADDTHRPEQLLGLVDALDNGADIVIASRYTAGSARDGVPIVREVLSAGISMLLRARFRLRGVRDYSCGYRAYRARVLQQAAAAYGVRLITAEGFAATTELLLKTAPFAERIAEVPLDLQYGRKAGPSKMPMKQTILAYLRLLCLTDVRRR